VRRPDPAVVRHVVVRFWSAVVRPPSGRGDSS